MLPAVKTWFFDSYGPGEVPGQYRKVIPNFTNLAMHGQSFPSPAPGKSPGISRTMRDIVNRPMRAERIGAAMLLSLIDDSVKLVIQNQASDRQADTIVLPSTTANTSKLAEKVLDSTINIPPLIYQNQGGIVGIYVARDVDFSSVYELKPTAGTSPREGTP